MNVYTAELHLHTVLSPCATVEMVPPLIVGEALKRGIDLIAVTDHNASANVHAVQRAAAGSRLAVLPGMELQTREEVHLLCLFDSLEQLGVWQSRVDSAMPPLENSIAHFGEQFVVDEAGEFLRRERRLLLTSADLSFETAVEGVSRLGGLAIPAHVDRPAFGLFAQLGLVPAGVRLEALEISRHLSTAEARRRFPDLRRFPLVQGGDAHRLDELLDANRLCLASPTIAEIRLALQSQAGRWLEIRTRDLTP